jgi:hypothetical protein
MSRRLTTSRCFVGLATCAALLSGFAAAAAQVGVEGASSRQVSVAAFAEHYALAGRPIEDLHRLEAQVATIRPRAIRLVVCERGATRALMAATHRFQHLPLHLQVAEASDPACASIAHVAARVDAGPRPLGIDDVAVASYWQEIVP